VNKQKESVTLRMKHNLR